MKRVKWNLCSECRTRFSNVARFLTVTALILAPLHAAAQGSDAMSVWPNSTQVCSASRIPENACHADQASLPLFLDLERQSLAFSSCVEGFDHACESLFLYPSDAASDLNSANEHATFQEHASTQQAMTPDRHVNRRVFKR